MKRVLASFLLIVMVASSCLCMTACSQSTPYKTSVNFLEALQNDDLDAAMEYVLPSDRQLLESTANLFGSLIGAGDYDVLMSLLSMGLSMMDLSSCYIDKEYDEKGDYAITYLRSDVYDIPEDECMFFLTKEDGKWYIRLMTE